MAFSLSINGILQAKTFDTTKKIAEEVGLKYGSDLRIDKVILSCSKCRKSDEKRLTENYLKNTITCYEMINNNHVLFGASKPQSIGYIGTLINCTNCNEKTWFNSF